MYSRSFPIALMTLIIAIAIMNGFAESYYWYWRIRWFDMPMHFAGGVWLAGTAVWWFCHKDKIIKASFSQIFAVCIIATLGVGLLWELLQAWLGMVTVGHTNAMSDTMGDLSFDLLGGIVVSIFTWLKIKQN